LKVKSFEELWNNPKTRELMKEIVIKRVEQMPDNLLLCLSGFEGENKTGGKKQNRV